MLADAELPRDNAFYHAHLANAELLTGVLRDRNWQVLDDLAARAASGDDPQAGEIITGPAAGGGPRRARDGSRRATPEGRPGSD